MKKPAIVLVLLILISTGLCNSQDDKSAYKIADKIHLDGDGGWDYLVVDDSTSRLYVSHSTVVQVVDLKKNKVIATIPDTKGVHGIALAEDLNKGYISNGKDTSVTVFDLKKLKTITKIKVTGNNPDAILYDPFSHRVFTFNGKSSNSTVIDANSDKVIETINLPGKPEFSVTNLKGKIYVNIESKSQVCQINAMTLKIEKTWSVLPGKEPSGMAIDIEDHQLFIVCSNALMGILDVRGSKIMSDIKIGYGVDGVVYDPELKRIYTSNGDGTMTVVQKENKTTFKVLENFPTQKGARTIALNPKTHRLYLPVAEYDAAPPETSENPHPRPTPKPGTFTILVIEPIELK
jgi:DNA-binding beta-propeller fold protein YncE